MTPDDQQMTVDQMRERIHEIEGTRLPYATDYHIYSLKDWFRDHQAHPDAGEWELPNDLEELYQEWDSLVIAYSAAMADAGAMFLDQNYPEWKDSVDPDHLRMNDGGECILGQAFGDYDYGIKEIWKEHFSSHPIFGAEGLGSWDSDRKLSDLARSLGFLENAATYFCLDLAWQREIAKRHPEI